MFLFELCSLWCGPRVSLQLYLLFLNAVFLAITDSRGVHTVGLKPLEEIQRLPKVFFDLLTVQGWTKKAKAPGDEESDEAWNARNLTPEAQQLAREHAQQQVFEVTHDARAFSMLQPRETTEEFRRALDKVRSATDHMMKVQTVPVQAALPVADARRVGKPGANDALALALQKDTTSKATRRSGSAPGRPVALPGYPQASRQQPVEKLEPVPIGRAYESRRADNKARGLVLASTEVRGQVAPSGPSAPSPLAKAGFAMLGTASSQAAPSSSARMAEPWPPADWVGDLPSSDSRGARDEGLLEAQAVLPAYALPRAPAEVYKSQVEPLLRCTASELIHKAIVEYLQAKAQQEPFGRVLKKISDTSRPDGPGTQPRASGGPLAKPTEPLWGEMNSRLQTILEKQGRRAERRKKRRAKARQRGGLRPPKATPGRELREYLDRHAAAMQAEGAARSEFVERVHEKQQMKHQLQRDKDWEFRDRFHGSLVADGFCDGSQVIRPIYVPPPGARA